jgi:hypothetical protein
MSEVILFDHIPKTAGTTMHRVLQRAVGEERLHYSTVLGEHPEAIARIAAELDRPLDGAAHAVVAHTGCGVEARLPSRHTYSRFTVLREPVARTVSAYFHMHDHGGLPAGMTFERFLREEPLHTFNSQTAFLGGLAARHHLGGGEITAAEVDRGVLEAALRELAAHDVVGVTDRFDETLLLLRNAYGWKPRQVRYRAANVGRARHVEPPTAAELRLVRECNQLDRELYEAALALNSAQLAERLPRRKVELARFRRLNGSYQRAERVLRPPARAVRDGARRLLPNGAFDGG